MTNTALSGLLARMAKDDALLREFCADPASVLRREGVVIAKDEIPKSIDAVEFSKRLKGAVASGATRVDLSSFSTDYEASKISHHEIGPTTPILHVDAGVGGTQ